MAGQGGDLPEYAEPTAVPEGIIKVPEAEAPIEGSGLYSMLKDFLPASADEESNKTEDEKKGEPEGGEPTGEPDKQTELPNLKLEEMKPEQLIEEVKKNQRISNERLNEINTFKAEVEKLKNNGGDPDVKAFLEALKEDPLKAWQTYAEKLKLPDPDVMRQIFATTEDADFRFKHWQDNVLKPQLEKKHNLVEGEFEYDPKDAYTKGTPSYDWRIATSQKEIEMQNETRTIQTSRQEQLQKAQVQQQQDIQWLADTYFSKDVTKVQEMVQQLNSIPEKISKGEMKPEDHPLALRSLVRGAFFDQLVDAKVQAAVNDIVTQYNSLGMHLPAKEVPTDVTALKGKDNKSVPQGNDKKFYSPLDSMLSRYL